MPSDEIIETMARAIELDPCFDDALLAGTTQQRIRGEHYTAVALAAAEAAGSVMVPRKPTREMVDAGLHALDFASTKTSRSNFTRVYRAMLAAAGEPD